MPRNRYTKQVRKLDRKQIERQETELTAVERRLRNQEPDPMEVPPVSEDKARRSARVEQKQRHKLKRRNGAVAATRSD